MNPENIAFSINMFNLFLIGAFVLSCLIGFLQGMRKSIVYFFTRVIPLLLLLLFLDLFTTKVFTFDFSMWFQLDQGSTIIDVLMNFASQKLNSGVAILPDSELYKFVLALCTGLARIIVFYIGVAICTLVITPILNIIARIIMKALKPKRLYDEYGRRIKNKKGLISRTIGAAVHGLRYAVIFILVTLPLFGPLSIVSTLEDEMLLVASNLDQAEGNTEQTDKMTELFDIVHEFDKITFRNMANQLSTSDKPLDALYFGYLMRVKTDNGTINFIDLVDDIENLLYLAGTYYHDGTFDFQSMLQNNPEALAALLSQSSMINVLAPVATEVLANFLGDIEIEGLENIDWTLETQAITEITTALANILSVAEFNYEDPLAIFTDPDVENAFGALGAALASSQVFNEIGLEYLYKTMNDYFTSLGTDTNQDFSAIVSALDFRDLPPTDWENNFKVLANLLGAVYELGIFEGDGEPQIDFTNSDAIARLVTKPFELSMVDGNEEALFTALFALIDQDNQLSEFGLDDITFSNIDWDTEPGRIADIINSFLTLKGENEFSMEFLYTKVGTPEMDDLIEKVFASEFIRINVLKILDSKIAELIDEQTGLDSTQKEELKTILKLSDLTGDQIQEDVELLLDILKSFDEMNLIGDGEADFSDLDKLADVITSFFDLNIVEGNESEIFDLLLELFNFNPVLENLGVTLDTSSVDWETEPEKIANIIVAFADFGDLENFSIEQLLNIASTEDGMTKVENLLNALCESEIFLPNLPHLVDLMLSGADLNEWYDDWFIGQLQEDATIDSAEWKMQMQILSDILVYVQSEGLDLTSISLNDTTTLDSLEELLLKLNSSKLFTLDPIADYIESSLVNSGIDGIDITNTPNGKENWDNEIESIFDIATTLNTLGNLDTNTISTSALDLGILLDTMKETEMLGGTTFDAIIDDFIKGTNYYTGVNPNGIFDDQYLEDLEPCDINWTAEMITLSQFDLTATKQSGEMIDMMASSELLLPIVTAEANKHISTFNDFINTKLPAGTVAVNELTKEEILTRATDPTWAIEIPALEALQTALNTTTNWYEVELNSSYQGSITTDTIAWDIYQEIVTAAQDLGLRP